MNEYSEDTLIEKPAIELFRKLGWQAQNCYYETFGSNGTLGRETSSEVVLVRRLRSALEKLNPRIDKESITLAIEELVRDRSTLSAANANREIYRLLKDGVKVSIRAEEGGDEATEVVHVLDWDDPENNDFFLGSQFWITGEMYTRRADLVGFVNGLPLLFVELKASHKRLEHAYQKNLRDYKDTIPHVFWHNALIILSNGSKSRIGTITAEWEHFAEWKKINDEGEEGVVSLETTIRGTCEKKKMLDLIENFTLFDEGRGEPIKMLAKNHQYLGVNRAIEAVKKIRENQGRLGVFWHTQGSGKSYSMVFFSQKIHRKIAGNWTFLVVTDRQDLDAQIYKNFAGVGVVSEPEERARAQSGAHLKELLREDHRYLFTLIQKFYTDNGELYPKLSDRSDIIVITDEAHRSQYDIFALNMRNALPQAAFIGFTGTPLIAGVEEKTRQVFGDYVSIYNFRQSVEDQNTVPLYYENRIPEVQLQNEDLNEDMERLLEEAELDEEQERKLEREFGREYNLITREERLEKIAEDIVTHFTSRGYKGKAMVVSIDKATAVRTYDKVQRHWNEHLAKMRADLAKARDEERQELGNAIKFMETTDMAVVVSQLQGEVGLFRKKGLDIATHRRRMVTEDMDEKFKNPKDPFRLVFVCAMWMTGFDAPSCSTIYLDKPMKNHTLMQTIARANRVFSDKPNGLIIDYVGVFRNLQKAMAIYGSGSGGGVQPGDMPVSRKSELLGIVKKAIDETNQFCTALGIDTAKIQVADGFERVRLIDDAADAILVSDETRRKYLALADNVDRLFRAILPDFSANEFSPARKLFTVLAQKIRALAPEVDISEVMEDVAELLDDSIAAEGYVITSGVDRRVDLSKLDFEALKARFAKGHKHIETERLKAEIGRKLRQMLRENRMRMDYLKKFQEMVDEYNSGSPNIEELFKKLTAFAQALNEEEKRAISEQLTEEELALFDLLTKPDPTLKKSEEMQVKKVARELLEKLKREKLVLDWRKRQQSRAAVRTAIEDILDNLPEGPYPKDVYDHKCELVYRHFYDSYFGENRSVYATATARS